MNNQIPIDSQFCNDPETSDPACPCFGFAMCRYWMQELEHAGGGHVGAPINVYKRLPQCKASNPQIK